jgi:signal peptidase I
MDFALVLFLALVATGAGVAWDRFVRRPRLLRDGKDVAAVKAPWLIEYSRAFFPVILIVFLLRSFLVEPFRIPSGSMLPSLHVGDFILVNKFKYGIRLPVVNLKVLGLGAPKRGDVMVFRFPLDRSVNFIKRVVGLPGDRIEYRNKQLFINGRPAPQGTDGDFQYRESDQRQIQAQRLRETLDGTEHDILIDGGRRSTTMDFTVPVGQYFVMGDNRDHSNDSRYWGFVPEENIVGNAFLIWFSWDGARSGVAWNRIGMSVR